MKRVTPEQVETAAIAAKVRVVNIRDCSICGLPVRYLVSDDHKLMIDTTCYCTNWHARPQECGFGDAADFINAQTVDTIRNRFLRDFGFKDAVLELLEVKE